MQQDEATICLAERADINLLVDIQCAAMPQALLVRCGRYFLKNALYPVALTHPDARVYLVRKQQELVGFVMYGKNPLFFKKQLAQKKVLLLISIAMEVMKSPLLLFECLQTREDGQFIEKNSVPQDCFHLFLIAVDPNQHSVGYGSQLLQATLPAAASYFKSDSCIVEARTRGAYNFYKKNKFCDAGYEMRGKTKFHRLFKDV